MFMSAAAATAEPSQDPVQRDPARGRLLGLVRRLIDYGRDLVASLQSRDTPTLPLHIAHRFGGASLVLIIARITRGLMIAAALENRLLHPKPRSAVQTRRSTPRGLRAPRQPCPDEEAELLGELPSAREIAARIRNQSPGAVLVEICRDLGITAAHPLWSEINDAIIQFRGNTVRLMRVWWRRAEQAIDIPIPPEIEARFEQLIAAYAQPP